MSRQVRVQLLVVVSLLLAAAPPAAAQPAASARCGDEAYRQFDFWVGSWEVHNADGGLLGRNEITRIARGCGLLENWQGAGGGGVSVNAYDEALGKWTQRWVGEGVNLWLEGGLAKGSMVLSGTARRGTPQGQVFDRITFTPLPDGRVLQEWEVSPDGRAWQSVFRGYYSRVAASSAAGR